MIGKSRGSLHRSAKRKLAPSNSGATIRRRSIEWMVGAAISSRRHTPPQVARQGAATDRPSCIRATVRQMVRRAGRFGWTVGDGRLETAST